jgi:hypothetical protein
MIEQTPVVGGVLSPVLQGVGETASGLGGALAQNGVGGVPIVGPTAAQAVSTVDTAVGGVATVSLGGQSVVGSGSAPIAIAALGSAAPQGSVASVGVLNAGQTVGISLGSPANNGATNGLADGLIGGKLAGASLTDAAAPLIGVSLASGTQAQGTLVTLGVVSGGQPLNVAVGDVAGGVGAVVASVAPALGGGSPVGGLGDLAALGGTVTNTIAPVTQTLTPVLTPVLGPVLGGGLGAVVGGAVGVVTPAGGAGVGAGAGLKLGGLGGLLGH